MLTERRETRPESDSAAQAYIPRNVWQRHVMGVFPRPRGHVLPKIPPEAHRIPWGCPDVSTRHRSPHVSNESPQEGTWLPTLGFLRLLQTLTHVDLGSRRLIDDNYWSAHSHASSRNHTISRTLCAAGSASTVEPHSSKRSEKDHSDAVSLGTRLPRNFTCRLAQDQREVDGQVRGFERDCRHCQCGL